MAGPTERRGVLAFVTTVGSLVASLGLLAWLRRHPGTLEHVFDIGDVLENHEKSGLTLGAFGDLFGRVELVILATIVAAVVTRGGRWARAKLTPFLVSMFAFAFVYVDATTRFAARIAGHLYVRPCDDALISMRYARNFADGHGLVYNAGEHVEGFTNLLWTLVMVVPHALGVHEGLAGGTIILFGGLLLVGAAFFVRAVLIDAGVPPTAQVLALLLVVFDINVFEFSVIGLETPLLTLACALVMAGGLRGRESWVHIGIATLVLSRADGAILAALLLGWLALEEAATSGDGLVDVMRRRWKHIALLAAITGAVIAWRLAVYGYPAPNTYYLKVYSFGARLRGGEGYGLRTAIVYALPVAFVLWAAAVDDRARRARRMLLPVLGTCVYAMYVGGDVFPYLRFVGPVTPLLWTAVGLAAAAGWEGRARWTNNAMFAGLLLMAPVKSDRCVLGGATDHAPEVRAWVVTAKTLERNVPEDAWIGTFFAGLPYYAPKHRFIDLLGKADARIAHQPRINGIAPGHNKFDFPYVYDERKPAVTFTAFPCYEVEKLTTIPRSELESMRDALTATTFHPSWHQLLDPTFRELYMPQRVILFERDTPAGHPIGCWFVRKDAAVPLTWQLAYE